MEADIDEHIGAVRLSVVKSESFMSPDVALVGTGSSETCSTYQVMVRFGEPDFLWYASKSVNLAQAHDQDSRLTKQMEMFS